MKLLVIRHAQAAARGSCARDAARPLTARGRAAFSAEVRGLARLGVRFDLVLHSPWLRAVETADLLAPIVRGRFAVTPRLAGPPSRELLDEVRGRECAVVGHEPWVSELAAWLVTSQREAASRFALKKGGVLVLDGSLEPGAMRVVAAYPPRALARLGS